MVDLDMERAKNLLKSAEDLYEQGDLGWCGWPGVCCF